MGAGFYLLIVGAAIVALIVGVLVGALCDLMENHVHDVVILLLAAAFAFMPLGAVLFGLLPEVCHRVHGLVWMFAFFMGVHLSEKLRRRAST